jgi:hypothetical protein
VGGGGLQSASNTTDQWQGQSPAQIQGHGRVQGLDAGRQPTDDATDFVPMSCVTVLTGFNSSLTPAEIVSMLPLPRDLFGTSSFRNNGTNSL